jgi:hypothetical protein
MAQYKMYSVCFKKQFLWAFFFLAVFGIVVAAKAMRLTDSAIKKYDAIVSAQPRKLRKDKLKQSNELSKQTRWGVHKTIVMSEKPLRRMVQIDAERSELSLFVKKNGGMQLQEVFYNAKATMQKELFYVDAEGTEYIYNTEGILHAHDAKKSVPVEGLEPMQRFRYFEAEKAVYDFDTDAFVAFDMHFWTYEIQGHELVSDLAGMQPVALGKAHSMTMSERFKDDSLQKLYAENLKITILNDRGLW